MPIRNVVLATIVFCGLLATIPATAQDGSTFHVGTDVPLPKGRHLASPNTPDPAYPLNVWIRINHNQWDGIAGYYHALGTFQLAGGTGDVFHFDYQCAVSFREPGKTQYHARWLEPGKKLQSCSMIRKRTRPAPATCPR